MDIQLDDINPSAAGTKPAFFLSFGSRINLTLHLSFDSMLASFSVPRYLAETKCLSEEISRFVSEGMIARANMMPGRILGSHVSL